MCHRARRSTLSRAGASTDSLDATTHLARFTVAGERGATINLSLVRIGDPAPRSGGELLVSVGGGIARRFEVQELPVEILVHRFAQADTVSVSYALPRGTIWDLRSTPVATQVLRGPAKVLARSTPWVTESINAVELATASGPARCLVPSPGTYCAVAVAFNPYFAGDPFGEFQNPSGSGVSEPIHIDFSPAVDNVSVAIADPDFVGNTLTVNTASGSTVHNFPGDGTPGTYTEFTIATGATGVTSIDLTPAPEDYVAYFGLSFTVND